MKKLLTIGLILAVMALALSACTNYESSTNTDNNDVVVEDSVGDPVLDNIADAPVEVVDEELDVLMEDISMDEW